MTREEAMPRRAAQPLPRQPVRWMGRRWTAQVSRFDARGLIGIALVLLVWQATATFGLISGGLFPSPAEVIRAWREWIWSTAPGLYSGSWAGDVTTSALRVAAGFAVASVVGIAVGIVIGYSRAAYAVIDPVVQLFRPIPAVAWVPLTVIIFGFKPSATVFLISYGAFFPIVLNTTAGVRRSQRTHVLVGRMLGTSRLQMLRYIVLPAALPSVFTGLRLGIGLSWILVIVGEMVAARSGLGYSLLNAYTVYRYDIVLAGMLSFGLLGLASDRLVQALENRLLAWRHGYDVAGS